MTFCTPKWKMALAAMIDREAFHLKTGATADCHIAAQLRRIADALERREDVEV